VPNVSRPAGLQVWPQDRNDRVTVLDYADPNEPLQPVRIVVARNGSFCGQLVVGCDKAIDALKVAVGELKGPSGSGAIAAEDTTLLYGLMDFRNRNVATWCDSLQEAPMTAVPVNKDGDGAVLPLLLRVLTPIRGCECHKRTLAENRRQTRTNRQVAPTFQSLRYNSE
jgi:hypothetical protein